MSKIPICLIGPSNYFKGGLTTYTQNLLNLLAQSSFFTPSVIFLNKFIPKKLFPGKNRNIKDYPLTIPPQTRFFNGLDWYLLPSLVQARKFLSQKPQNQAFVLQWWSSSVLHIYLLFTYLLKICCPRSKIIIEIHEVFDPLEQTIKPLGVYVKYFLPLLLKKADYLFFHSPQEALDFSTRFKLSKSSIQFVKHIFPVNTVENVIKKDTSNRIVILFFGLIRDYKGVPLLLRSFNELMNTLSPEISSKVHLQIVGEIWDDKRLIFSLFEHSLYKANILIKNSYIPDVEIPNYFKNADVLVLPYLRGTQSGVLNLGMHFSLPIITTKVGGFAETLADYEPKFLIEPNNQDQLVSNLQMVVRKVISSSLMINKSSKTIASDVNNAYLEKLLQLTSNSTKR